MDDSQTTRSRRRPRGRAARRPAPALPRGGAPARRIPELCELAPFSVFCALYLGITEDDGWREPRFDCIAARFGLSDAELASWLEAHGLAEAALRSSGFDLAGACLDISVAPAGVSRLELARGLYQEFESTRSS